jgi:protein-glutamine gamma-glutamyltransferase
MFMSKQQPSKIKQTVGCSCLLFTLTLILHNALPVWFMLVIGSSLVWNLLQASPVKLQLFGLKLTGYKVTVLQVNIVAAVLLTGLLLNTRQAGVLNVMLQMLLLAANCRLLLLQRETERQQLIWVQYFLIASCFILHQSILMALLIFALIVLNLYLHYQLYAPASIKIQQRAAIQIVGIIIPLWLGSFILFPRLAPFWQIPNMNLATTGLGDSIDPGSIEQLVQDDSVAFRVEFTQSPPAQQQLYWRAKLYEQFDGRSWHLDDTATKANKVKSLSSPKTKADTKAETAINYRIFAEPSQQRSLFSLADPIQSQGQVQIQPAGLVQADNIISQRLRYQLSSIEQPIALASAAERARNLQLAQGNNASKAFAQQLFANQPKPDDFVAALARHFNQQAYFYSLTPPRLGKDSIDQFLFQTKTGFCSHYASAAAFMLRSVGIPARVVGGYQGGNWYAEQNYLQVTQREAHAWVEYLVDQHWYRFDPTAAVAPERVLQDLNAALTDEQRQLLHSGWLQLQWLNDLRQQWRHIDYYWSVWVLGFDTKQQLDIWRTLKRYAWQLGMGLVVMLTVIGLLLLLWQQAKRRQNQPAATQLMLQYLPSLWRCKDKSNSVSGYLRQLSITYPLQADLLTVLATLYDKALYQQDRAALAALRQVLRRDKRQLRRFFSMIQNT